MGIEKVLKENFDDLGQVIQVDGEEEVPMELSTDMVMVEVNRIGPAIFAMGGQYELVGVNGETGSVELKFKGPNKLQQGLELALLDIPQCNYVKFSMYDE
jgi:Fe-S cluster biogenesis protein NfuA